MAKLYIINSKTKIITNIVDSDDKYDPPHGREIAKGTGKVGDVIKEKRAAKKSVDNSTG